MKHAMNTSHQIHVAFEQAGKIKGITGEAVVDILCSAMDASKAHPTASLFDVLSERLSEARDLAMDERWEPTEQGIEAGSPANFRPPLCEQITGVLFDVPLKPYLIHTRCHFTSEHLRQGKEYHEKTEAIFQQLSEINLEKYSK